MEKEGVFIPKPHGGGSSSTEADVDIATSLFLAKRKWKYGGQQEHIDYGAEAVDLARCVWKKCFNQEIFMPLIGDWAKEGADSFKRVSSGHFILGGYWMLQQEDIERSEQWAQVIERIITVLQEQLAMNPKTGLLANYLVLNGDGKYVPFTGKMCGLDHCGTHNRDSCKIPWRLSNYYALTGDARVKPTMEAQANFFAKKLSHGGIHLVYTLDGISVGKLCYQKNVAAPVRLLFGALGWNDRYEEMVDKTKDAESWNDSTGYSIDLVCTLQYHGKA